MHLKHVVIKRIRRTVALPGDRTRKLGTKPSPDQLTCSASVTIELITIKPDIQRTTMVTQKGFDFKLNIACYASNLNS